MSTSFDPSSRSLPFDDRPRPSSSLSLPSSASSRTLVRGASPSVSSRTSRFVRRGRMMSHTRSSVRSWSTNSSKWRIE